MVYRNESIPTAPLPSQQRLSLLSWFALSTEPDDERPVSEPKRVASEAADSETPDDSSRAASVSSSQETQPISHVVR